MTTDVPHAARALLLRPLPDGYHFRDYDPDIAWRLHEIDRLGTRLIAEHGFPSLASEPMPPLPWYRDWLASHIVFVAADRLGRPVGFSVAAERLGPGNGKEYEGEASVFYLHMLSVDPAHGGRGIGAALLEANVSRARWADQPAIALSTFRTVPFNAPFYRRHGFHDVDIAAVDPVLREQFRSEVPNDVLPSTRTLMMRRL